MPNDDLDHLRAQISTIDAEIIALAARRQEIVRRVAEAKARTGGEQPIFDRSREARVLARAAEQGADAGLPVGTAERLLRVLIETSHETQEARLRIAPELPGQTRARFLIIGGEGEMGRLLTRTFRDRGCEVATLDADTEPEQRARAIAAADIVIVSVPMARAVEVTREAVQHVRDDALLCDINSLKADVCEALRDAPGEALGLHPMFGPTVQSFRRQKIVVCPIVEGPRAAWLRRELGHMGVELVESDPETHDRMMAVVQMLVHYATVVMGEALRTSGTPIAESLRFTSPIYRLELSIVGRLFAQDPGLYAEIVMENPHAAEMLAHFNDAAREVARAIESGDRGEFRRLFEETGAYFADFAAEALALSDSIIDDLVRRP